MSFVLVVAAAFAGDLVEDRHEQGSVPVYGDPSPVALASQAGSEPELEPEPLDDPWDFGPEIVEVHESPTPQTEPVEALPDPPESRVSHARRMEAAADRGEASVEAVPIAAGVGAAIASTAIPVAGCVGVAGLSMIVMSPVRPKGLSEEEWEVYRDAYKAELRRRRLVAAVMGGTLGSAVGLVIYTR